jgi:hypothetical protein
METREKDKTARKPKIEDGTNSGRVNTNGKSFCPSMLFRVCYPVFLRGSVNYPEDGSSIFHRNVTFLSEST